MNADESYERYLIAGMSIAERHIGFAKAVEELRKKWLIHEVLMRIDRTLEVTAGAPPPGYGESH